jgi:hypothetical protein
MKFFGLCFFLAVILFAQAQFDEEDPVLEPPTMNQQQQAMNQEVIEALWNLLTPQCKTEMESALGTKSDISPQCKAEVQNGLISLSVIPDPMKTEQQEGRRRDDGFQSQSQSKDTQIPSGSPSAGRNAIIAIVTLVVTLLGGVIGYVIYYNKQNPAGQEAKPKKLSRKKVIFDFLFLFRFELNIYCFFRKKN